MSSVCDYFKLRDTVHAAEAASHSLIAWCSVSLCHTMFHAGTCSCSPAAQTMCCEQRVKSSETAAQCSQHGI